MAVAADQFEVWMEPFHPKLLHLLGIALAAVAFYVTFGLVEIYPKVAVRVRRVSTGNTIVEHIWSNPRSAHEDVASIAEALRHLTPEAFEAAYSRQSW